MHSDKDSASSSNCMHTEHGTDRNYCGAQTPTDEERHAFELSVQLSSKCSKKHA